MESQKKLPPPPVSSCWQARICEVSEERPVRAPRIRSIVLLLEETTIRMERRLKMKKTPWTALRYWK